MDTGFWLQNLQGRALCGRAFKCVRRCPTLRHSEDGQRPSILMAPFIKIFFKAKEIFQCLKDDRPPLCPLWTCVKLANYLARSQLYQQQSSLSIGRLILEVSLKWRERAGGDCKESIQGVPPFSDYVRLVAPDPPLWHWFSPFLCILRPPTSSESKAEVYCMP